MSAPVRIALVGAGAMGRRHARALLAVDGALLAVVVDPHTDRAERIAAEAGGRATTRIEDALACDAAIVATPADHHVGPAVAFLEAGRPVLVEKPLAEDLAGVWRIIETSERCGVPVMCGFVERFNPVVTATAALLSEPPLRMAALRHSPPVPRVRTGVVHDMLIHDIDLAIRFAGDAAVDRVDVVVGDDAPVGAPGDTATCVLGFANGATASLSANRSSVDRQRVFVIDTPTGRFDLDLARRALTRYDVPARGGDAVGTVVETGRGRPGHRPVDEPLALQLQHFLALVEGRGDAGYERRRLTGPHLVAARILSA